MYDVVIRGKLVLADEVVDGEIGINNGKIETVSKEKDELCGKELHDFGNKYVFPGMIDTHVHCFSNPVEGFLKTSSSAAVGGITTFLDMPYDSPDPVANIDQFNEKVEKLKEEAVMDIGLWGTIQKRNGTDQIIPLAKAGATAFKMSTFETNERRFPRIPDTEILKAMRLLKKTGLRAAFHSENNEIIVDMIEQYQNENKVYPRAHMETRPPVSETTAVLKLMEFAYWTGVKLHIVHISHPRTMELIENFQSQGIDVTSETCYPYLLLDVNDLEKLGPKAKNNPPLREPEVREALWEKVKAEKFNIITSDHSPWSLESKEKGNDNIFEATSGFPGLEIMVPLMFETVGKGWLTPVELAKLMAQHPAEVFQIPSKGKIEEGYDGDLTIIDPEAEWTIDERLFYANSKPTTPFNGKKVKGKIATTIVRGAVVYDGENITVDPGFGNFVPGSAAGGNYNVE